MKTGWLNAIEWMLNRVLALDEGALAAIGQLNGKVLAIEVPRTDIRFLLALDERGIRVRDERGGPPDVTIRGTPLDLVRYLLAGRDGVSAGDLEITGDVSVAQRLHGIFAQLEPDWEETLSEWIGDTAARKLGILAQSVVAGTREARRSLAMDLSEYLRFEKDLLPERGEVEEFLSSIDRLRDDAARLNFRIDRLLRDRRASD